jgi:Protein of unknown function (Hypoth_ymh)
VDDAAAVEFLSEFLGFLNESKTIYDGSPEYFFQHPRWAPLQEQINASLIGVRRLAEVVEPGLVDKLQTKQEMYLWEWSDARDATHQLRGAIEQHERIDRILQPVGPTLAAAGLHAWVWQPVVTLWDDGHYLSALQMAATSVCGQLQAKLGRPDLADSDLVTQAFTCEPPKPGSPRLRFTEHEEGSRAFTSAHEGAMFFGRGCVMGIRNVSVHDIEGREEQVALEQLAALSVLARWIDDAAVVEAREVS